MTCSGWFVVILICVFNGLAFGLFVLFCNCVYVWVCVWMFWLFILLFCVDLELFD